MTTPISTDQWNALRAAGHTDAQISAHYHLAQATPHVPPPPPQLPMGGAPMQHHDTSPPGDLDLSGAAYGVGEGRIPEDGTHEVEILEVFRKRTYYGPKFIIVYKMIASSNPANEIGGEYSKGYSEDASQGFGRSLDDIKGWIATVLEARGNTTIRQRWENSYVPEVAASQPGDAHHRQPARGLRFQLRTEKREPTRGRNPWTKHEWRLLQPGQTIAAVPPMPAAVPPMPAAVPPMPAAVPPMPSVPPTPSVPPMPAPSVPGGSAYAPPTAAPPGWMGAWPPRGGT